MTKLLDFSFDHPSIAAIKGCGAVGVLRYLTRSTPPKLLTAAEAKGYRAAGLWVGVVFEDGKGRAGQGQHAGAADAVLAAQQARALGMPTSCPIFFAVDDENVSAATATPYFQGIREAKISNPIGVYGSFAVVEGISRAGLAGYAWQTVAWSGGHLSPLAHLFQRADGQLLPGTDTNDLLRPLPLWGAPVPVKPHVDPKPPPTPAPVPVAPDLLEEDMRIVYVNGSAPLLVAGDGRQTTLSNAEVADLRAWGVPVHSVSQPQLDGGRAAIARLA